MAPDRGDRSSHSSASDTERRPIDLTRAETADDSHDASHRGSSTHLTSRSLDLSRVRSDHGLYKTSSRSPDAEIDATNFTIRGTFVGLLIGVIICFSNTYFGLQTGWVSGMAMPASLIGFAIFKSISRQLTVQFTPVENVLVQTVAGAVGTMPLGCGFVGVMPALQFLLKKSEGAPLELGMGQLIIWSLGICLFGVVFAVPLRKEVIIREKLKFPSGTATALMIGVLHGGSSEKQPGEIETQGTEERHALLQDGDRDDGQLHSSQTAKGADDEEADHRSDWKAQIRLLLIAFTISAVYTLISYFVPQIRDVPIFGPNLAYTWLWTLNPSPAYIGQGIIMGPATTLHMLLGAVIGWGVLSPLAKKRGWAPGPVTNWETGSKGWIVWVSLAIMLADSVVNLGWLVCKPLFINGASWIKALFRRFENRSSWKELLYRRDTNGYSAITTSHHTSPKVPPQSIDEPPDDAPPHHLVTNRTVAILLPLTLVLCVVCIHVTFGEYIPIHLTLLSTVLALLLSVMGVRALGETDLNPVSGISKLTQLVFALVIPSSGKIHDNAIIINLLAGAVSESGALQAGDMMQDLKAGHLIGASPKAQFYGQMIGSVFGAIISASVYKLYISVYPVPGDLFQIPTAFVWIFTARLVTGKGLPAMAWQFAVGAGAIFAIATALRILCSSPSSSSIKIRNTPLSTLHPFVPGGIAVAVGMYNTPSFTLARTIGGLVSWYWVQHRQRGETKVIVLASGLILGEGVVSILNLGLASLSLPHT